MGSDSKPGSNSFRSALLTGAKFLLLGVPGGFLFVLGIIILIGETLEPIHLHTTHDLLQVLIAAGATALGFPMMMYGVDRWGQWRYVYVFLSIPVSMFVLGFIHVSIIDPKLDLIFCAIPAFFVFRAVKKSYERTA